MSTRSGLLAPDHRGATVALLGSGALSAFEALSVAAALPAVAGDLGGVHLLPWVLSGYLLAAGVATVVAGAAVDRRGAAAVFRGAILVFAVGGLLCGLAPTMPLLVAARVVQGAGGGAIAAVALASVGVVYPRELVGRAYAASTTAAAVCGLAAPAVAAVLLRLDGLGVAPWRWLFLLTVPLAAVGLRAGWSALPAEPTAQAGVGPPRSRWMTDRARAAGTIGRARGDAGLLDVALLLLVGGGVLVAVDELGPASVPAAAVAAGALAVLVGRDGRRGEAALGAVHLLRRPVGPLGWTIGLLLAGVYGVAGFLPVHLVAGRGLDGATAAWSAVLLTVGWVGGATAAGRSGPRVAPVVVLRCGLVVTSAGLAVLGALSAAAGPLPAIAAAAVLAGAGTGAATNAAFTLLRVLGPPGGLGRATAAHLYVRNLGFACGNALAGALLLLVVTAATGDAEAVRAALLEGGAAWGGGGPGRGRAAEVASAVRLGFALYTAAGSAVVLAALLPLRTVRSDVTPDDVRPS